VVSGDSEDWGFEARRRGVMFWRMLPGSRTFRGSRSLLPAGPGCRAIGALAVFAIIFPSLVCSKPRSESAASSASKLSDDWVLSWHDEFNGPNGAPPDEKKWLVETGGNGWGNSEREYYTSRPQNIRQQNGYLVIEAIKEKFTGPDGIERDYTSGRVNTKGRFSQEYGRFEARIKNPPGRGVWPAFWLLGDDFSTAGWPACGEIDIMEGIGPLGSQIRGSLHGPGYSGRNSLTSTYQLPAGNFSDAFHIFALEWEPKALRFYVDGHLYAAKTPSDLRDEKPWVYNHPFFLILDLAVRGDIPNSPEPSTIFPQRMLVDYVRVYTHK